MTETTKIGAEDEGSRAGFTLVELLVAVAIMVGIAAALFQVLMSASDQWQRIQGRTRADLQARRVLDRLEADLQGMILPAADRGWLKVTVQKETGVSPDWVSGHRPIEVSFAPATEPLADARFGLAGSWLRLVTTQRSRGASSTASALPTAVSYQLIRRPSTQGVAESRYCLYRSELAPDESLAIGYDLGVTDHSGGALDRPATNTILAENVVDFGLRLYAFGRSGETVQLFPTAADREEYSAPESTSSHELIPRVVDLMVRVLTDEGARQIGALETGTLSGDWWQIATAHSHVYTRRILVRAEGISP